jgi:hypothetical protein
VTSTFEACGGFGTTVEERIDLVAPSGRHERIMTFLPWVGVDPAEKREPLEPLVTWTEPAAIRVTLGTVGRIIEKHDDVDGVHITYATPHQNSFW